MYMAKKKQVESTELTELKKEIKKFVGREDAMFFDDSFPKIERLTSGSLLFDMALGGGYPKGRIVELVGDKSCGKTTLATIAIAEFQKQNPLNIAGYIDAEFAFDKEYAEHLGMDMSRTMFYQPSIGGEDALTVVESMIKTGKIGLIVVDSVSALRTKAELEGDIGDQKMATQARMFSTAIPRLIPIISKYGTTVIFINQFRINLGQMYGDNRTPTGGNALGFYTSQIIQVSKGQAIMSGDEPIGINMRIYVTKNKVSVPFKKAETELTYFKGFDRTKEVITLAADAGIITRAGSWYSYGDTKLAQGLEKTIELIRDNPELYDELYERVMNYAGK